MAPTRLLSPRLMLNFPESASFTFVPSVSHDSMYKSLHVYELPSQGKREIWIYIPHCQVSHSFADWPLYIHNLRGYPHVISISQVFVLFIAFYLLPQAFSPLTYGQRCFRLPAAAAMAQALDLLAWLERNHTFRSRLDIHIHQISFTHDCFEPVWIP